jgi:CubicO group peptidase (beta-lactamase class C family)
MKKTHRILSVILTLLVAALSPAMGQGSVATPKVDKKAIDKYLKTEMGKEQIPGLAYAVMINGKLVDSGAYGVANVELGSPVTLHTKFNLGSIGKTFTATAVMMLAKEGKLSLDEPVGKYLDSLPASWKAITIRHLLNHTSGIKDYTHDFPGYSYIEKRDRKQEYSEADFTRMATEVPLNFKPGERFAYSSSNFVLLGFIVHKISGMILPEFMRQHVFAPSGMSETVYMTQSEIIPGRAHGYLLDDRGKLMNGNYISDFFSSTGDMGVTTTVGDLVKWSVALDNGTLLDKETLHRMWTPAQLTNGAETNFFGKSYAMGWFVENYRGFDRVGHSGSFMNGYTADYARYPELGLTVIVLANLNPTNIVRIGCNVAGFYFPALKGIDQHDTMPMPNSALIDNVKKLMISVITDKPDTRMVTPGFSQRLNPITRLLMGDSSHLPAVQYLYSDVFTNPKVSRRNVAIKKIDHYKILFSPNPDDSLYLSLYLTQDDKIEDWSTY